MAPCEVCGATAIIDASVGPPCCAWCGEPLPDAWAEAYDYHHATEARAAMWEDAA